MSKSEIRDVFENFDVVAFLEQHNVKYDEWLKSQIFQLIHAIEKDVVKVLDGCVCVPQELLQNFKCQLADSKKTQSFWRLDLWLVKIEELTETEQREK